MPVKYLPKTCFIMCQLRKPVPEGQVVIRQELTKFLMEKGFSEIDAGSSLTGRDFLNKIWGMAFQVPIGIAIITRHTSRRTFANIFYEMGLLQAYGKETLVIKTSDVTVPSDFIRTEYLEYGADFEDNLDKYFDVISALQEHFDLMAEQLKHDPLLAIDYMRRAFLLTGDDRYRAKAKLLRSELHRGRRVPNCVEDLLTNF
ncbi:MAG: hypothetical protein HYX90_00225 [Chloroflexi bacterium]|nr:hypothetical protein [Chloroflexota bacterium]